MGGKFSGGKFEIVLGEGLSDWFMPG